MSKLLASFASFLLLRLQYRSQTEGTQVEGRDWICRGGEAVTPPPLLPEKDKEVEIPATAEVVAVVLLGKTK